VVDIRPGYLGIVGGDGRYLEDGWVTLGLPSEQQTDGGSYADLKERTIAKPTATVEAKQTAAADGRVGAAQALKMQRVGYKLIDLRTPEEYAKDHPAGALNVPHQFFGSGGGFKPNADFLPVMQALFDKNTKLVLMDKTGKRSPAAVDELKAAGYTTVCDVRPGFIGIVGNDGRYLEDGWQTLGLPTEKQTDGGSYAELKDKAGR
jgi:rhodanese-related sulfurtransferase